MCGARRTAPRPGPPPQLRRDKTVALPSLFGALFTLLRHAGKLVTRKHLFRCVWGTDSESKLYDLRVYIANLRQKFREASSQVLIQTEGCAGYRILVPSSDSIEGEAIEPNLKVA